MLLLAVAALFAQAPAYAQDARSLTEAVQKVRQSTGGKILSAHRSRRGDREVYVIKVLDHRGSVRTVRLSGPAVQRPQAGDDRRSDDREDRRRSVARQGNRERHQESRRSRPESTSRRRRG